MTESKDFDFHPDLKGIFGKNGNDENKKNKKNWDENIFKLALFILLIGLTWLLIILIYISYIDYSRKYDNVLNNINHKLKADNLKLDKINTNLIFFKKVNRNQVNVSYILYLLSMRRFGRTYIKSISANNGQVNISIFSLERGFARSLNLMNDYKLYLNIYGLQMHTGRFRITYISENSSRKKIGIAGRISSVRFPY
jgi:hypothetical protein